MSANEIGDFLAGAFAPLAFIWLIATVLLQSAELRAQREELELTRDEMRQAREVMEAQRREAQRSADFIGVQTDVLSSQHKRAEEAVNDAEIEQLFASLRVRAEDATAVSFLFDPGGRVVVFPTFTATLTTAEYLRELTDFVDRQLITMREYRVKNISGVSDASTVATADRVIALVDWIMEKEPTASSAMRLRIGDAGIARLSASLREIFGGLVSTRVSGLP